MTSVGPPIAAFEVAADGVVVGVRREIADADESPDGRGGFTEFHPALRDAAPDMRARPPKGRRNGRRGSRAPSAVAAGGVPTVAWTKGRRASYTSIAPMRCSDSFVSIASSGFSMSAGTSGWREWMGGGGVGEGVGLSLTAGS